MYLSVVAVALSWVTRDGMRMANKQTALKDISQVQQRTLLAIIDETFGAELIKDEFEEAMLDLFENISGFEAISQEKANHIVQQLWSLHNGKEADSNV